MFWDIRSPFTATPFQVSTYLLGVALFSIAFLVFLNSSISFVITDLLYVRHGVGNAVGTLGFADELLALLACPVWGLLSDRIGVRAVTVTGYGIIGLSLCVFVSARNIYPQLLLARLFFSLGGAATSTMVTAILPIMTLGQGKSKAPASEATDQHSVDGLNPINDALDRRNRPVTAASSVTMTPERFSSSTAASSIRSQPHSASHIPANVPGHSSSNEPGTSQIAGLVGMFTGCGALVALGLFLPLPARLREIFEDRAVAVQNSFYLVGIVALLVGVFCFFGLRSLAGEEAKGFGRLVPKLSSGSKSSDNDSELPPAQHRLLQFRQVVSEFIKLGFDATKLGLLDTSIALGYLGGFVARASSVAISLFIPLYVNQYFISTGLCKSAPYDPSNPRAGAGNLKEQCERAYKLAAALTGASQLIALLCAPLFGWIDGRFRKANAPLVVASAVGVAGYIGLARMEDPDPESRSGATVFVVMAALGVSQIGCIVCSLSSLGRGIQKGSENDFVVRSSPESIREEDEGGMSDGNATLVGLETRQQGHRSRSHLKGSIAGIYSLAGGAGILLLTKLGGFLFDKAGHGAPFYLMALFNIILFAAAVGTDPKAIDFSSNDFLSLSRSPDLRSEFLDELRQAGNVPLGSGGSRLLDGNSAYVEQLEKDIATFHDAPAGLFFNSGFDANSALFSCVPQPGDTVVYDEFIHASVHEGMRLSKAGACVPFAHNDLQDFRRVLQDQIHQHSAIASGDQQVLVAVETVYSMDGDVAPIRDILDVLSATLPAANGHMIVDEAHSTGVYGDNGRGLVCELGVQERILARLHTFGKALASTGAIVLCAPTLREYLFNYARSLIYTTAPGLPSLAMIASAYRLMRRGATVQVRSATRKAGAAANGLQAQTTLWHLIEQFHGRIRARTHHADLTVLPSPPSSPIAALRTSRPRELAAYCQRRGVMVRAVVHPTVPRGTERVRVCLHAGNTLDEIDQLVAVVAAWLRSRSRCDGAAGVLRPAKL
ncbi:MAG: hypothetical protein Q9162_007533 [Coniocarpon cinnabarinum]